MAAWALSPRTRATPITGSGRITSNISVPLQASTFKLKRIVLIPLWEAHASYTSGDARRKMFSDIAKVLSVDRVIL